MTKVMIDKVIKKEAKMRKMAINQMAIECSIPTSILHSWANGTLPSAKNLHHIQTLSKYLGITVEELLFGIKGNTQNKILFSSTFVDGDSEYRIVLEKIS